MNIKPLSIIVITATSAAAFGLGWALKPGNSDSTESPVSNGNGARATLLTPKEPLNAKADSPGAALTDQSAAASSGSTTVLTAENIGASVKQIMNENDPLKKATQFSELLAQLTPENAAAAYDALRETSRRGGRGGFGQGGDEVRLLLNAWGRVDGKGAVAELTAREEKRKAEAEANGEGDRGRGGRGGDRGDFGGTFDLHAIISGWATEDASGASEFVNTIEDDRQRGMLSNGIVRGLLVEGVDNAMKYISALPADDESRRWHMGTIAEEMLEQGTDTAANWISSIDDPSLRKGAMDRIVETFAREDIDGAVAWAEQHAGQDYSNNAVSQVAERWAESDPQAVIDWAGTLPETAQAGVFQQALDEWTKKDPLAASQYLSAMPDSAVKNSAVEGFATELSKEDGQSAVTWAETITDPELRTKTLERVARDWFRQDKEAVTEWLPSSGLPEETVKGIVESQDRGGRGDWGRGRGR